MRGRGFWLRGAEGLPFRPRVSPFGAYCAGLGGRGGMANKEFAL